MILFTTLNLNSLGTWAVLALVFILLFPVAGCRLLAPIAEHGGGVDIDNMNDAFLSAVSELSGSDPERALALIEKLNISDSYISSMARLRNVFMFCGAGFLACAVFLFLNKDLLQAGICIISAVGCFGAVAVPDSYYRWFVIGLIALIIISMVITSGRTKGGLFSYVK